MESKKPYTISEFIEVLNASLKALYAEIIGEVSEINIAASGHAYFTLKDKDTGETLSCVMWKNLYLLCGVELEVGMEIQIKGCPNFTGKFGKLSFITNAIELIGEGALKKAYDKLKKKLEAEGLFEISRKKPIPPFPQNIGVITSMHGAVIHDFSNNLRRSGFRIKMLDCRVEGPESGRYLALSVRALRNENLDALVLIRGGGSMQSLAGFNNEALVREIAKFPVPVITGIGHHQDMPLAALVADAAESTPSLVAALLCKAWTEATYSLEINKQKVFNAFEGIKDAAANIVTSTLNKTKEVLDKILKKYEEAKRAIRSGFLKIESKISYMERGFPDKTRTILKSFNNSLNFTESKYLFQIPKEIKNKYVGAVRIINTKIINLNRLIETNNPERQLSLGYSIVFSGDKVIRSVKDTKLGEKLNIRVMDGEIMSEVKNIK